MHRAVVDRLLFPMQEWLKGKPTFAMLREPEKTQWLDAAALRELEFRVLRRHLEFASSEVPYHARLWTSTNCRHIASSLSPVSPEFRI